MRISSIGILKHVELEAECPVCGELTGTEGSLDVTDLGPTIGFWCDKTDKCPGDFRVPINWGDELNKLIASKQVKA